MVAASPAVSQSRSRDLAEASRDATRRLFLLVAKSDPLAKHKRLQLKDLGGIRYMGLAGGTTRHSAIEHAARERGIDLTPAIVFDDFDTAKIFVELDLGQAIVPAVHAHNFERTGSVKAVLMSDLPPISIGWAFRHWNHLPPPRERSLIYLAVEGKLSRV